MRGNVTSMLVTIFVLSAICGLAQSSGINIATQAGPAPVVTAASSQYFERTFNRLITAPSALQPIYPVAVPPPVIPIARSPSTVPAQTVLPIGTAQPTIPIAHIPNVIRLTPPQRVIPFQPGTPVSVEPTLKNNQEPAPSANPSQNIPSNPNVAIAIATANAAAPVATILLPPYPFGPPPSFGFIPSSPMFNVPEDKRDKESTTETTIRTEATTTERENETTTPVPSNIDNSFVQALPSNDNVNFRQYLPPPFQLPLEPVSRPQTTRSPVVRPQKVKTAVEVVPVPLTYIAPPPLKKFQPVKLIKVTRHIHTFIPTGKIIIRPVSHKIRTVVKPDYVKVYRKPALAKNVAVRYHQTASRRTKIKDVEPTTFSPSTRPNIRPPRL